MTAEESIDIALHDGQSSIFVKYWLEQFERCDRRRIEAEHKGHQRIADVCASMRDGWLARCERYTEALGPRLYTLVGPN